MVVTLWFWAYDLHLAWFVVIYYLDITGRRAAALAIHGPWLSMSMVTGHSVCLIVMWLGGGRRADGWSEGSRAIDIDIVGLRRAS